MEGEGKRLLHLFKFSDRHQIDLGFFTTAFRESDGVFLGYMIPTKEKAVTSHKIEWTQSHTAAIGTHPILLHVESSLGSIRADHHDHTAGWGS